MQHDPLDAPTGDEDLNSPDPGALRDARSAICSFLAGFGLDSGTIRGALIDHLMEGARRLWCGQPEQSLAQCALQYAEQRFEAWLDLILGTEASDDRSSLLVGRAAFLLCGGAGAWAELVLVCDDVPQPFIEAMRAAAPTPTPNAVPGVMSPQSLEAWSMADAAHIVVDTLGEPLTSAVGGREVQGAPIKLIKP